MQDVASALSIYVSAKFGSRRGVDVGSITLHPSGLPHGPQPGLAEKSIGTHETHELAVMCDTFYPLKLTKFAKDLDDGKYPERASLGGPAVGHSAAATRRWSDAICCQPLALA